MRKTFLARVAEKLYEKYGDNLSDLHIIFPSQRAQVFFERELSILLDKPLWQPTYDSIDNLVKEFSMLEKAHPIKLLTELYLAYTEVTASNENLDEFYTWGELLLADFDTIDKYRVNAEKLFSNIESLSELDELFDTDTEEKTLIINFWKSFSKKKSKYSDAFLSNWKNLHNIYLKFRERLNNQGLAYSGMIYREAATKIAKNDCSNLPQYAFVGFNALNRCEQKILSTLVKHQKIEFYWDADKYYLDKKEQEAGEFLRRNISMFGEGEITPAREMTAPNKNLTVVKSPGEIMQCKALYKELEELQKSKKFYTPEYNTITERASKIYTAYYNEEAEYDKKNPSLLAYSDLVSDLSTFNSFSERYKGDGTPLDNIIERYEIFAKAYPKHIYTKRCEELIKSAKSIRVGGKYIDFSAPDLDGNIIKLSSEIKGKIAIIDLWASWCGPCRNASESYIPIYNEFKERGFTIVGVARERGNDKEMRKAIKQDGYTWTNLLELDNKGKIWEKYGMSNGAGLSLLVDEKGTILAMNPTAQEVRKILLERLD